LERDGTKCPSEFKEYWEEEEEEEEDAEEETGEGDSGSQGEHIRALE
jgi:hypothetical protein